MRPSNVAGRRRLRCRKRRVLGLMTVGMAHRNTFVENDVLCSLSSRAWSGLTQVTCRIADISTRARDPIIILVRYVQRF